MKFKSHLARFSGPSANVYGLHIPLPDDVKVWIDQQSLKRVICIVNSDQKQHSGIMHHAAYDYMLISKVFAEKAQIEVGDSLNVELQEDTSTYGMDMPEELEEMLIQAPLVNEYFHLLTPGKQRNLIYIVSQVKSPKSRMAKVLAIADHLTNTQGALDFKALNQLIKYYNQQNKLKS